MTLEDHLSAVLAVLPERVHPLVRGVYRTIVPPADSTHAYGLDAVPDALPTAYSSNTELLADRGELLEKLPSGGTVAEVGVETGNFATEIHSVTDPDRLHLVDIWDYTENMAVVEEKFAEEIDAGRVELHREDSIEALAGFDDGYFDWVYIDTSHFYERTLEELRLSSQKVRDDGVIAGHDYCVGNLPEERQYGVIPAVHQFCVESDYELRYLTLESHGHSSFALETA
jgi:predicted O-methyltransferase YrrM